MGLFKSKEERLLAKKQIKEEKAQEQKRKEEEKIQKEKEEEQRRVEGMEKYQPFLNKLNKAADAFVKALAEKEVCPTWGVEAELYIDVHSPWAFWSKDEDVTVFSPPSMEGLAFDDFHKKCVYYGCNHSTYSSAIVGGYFDIILEYRDILSVKVEVDDVVKFQSKTAPGDVLGGAIIGGIVGGGVGALIGASSGPTSTEQKNEIKKVSLCLLTTNPQHRVITLVFDRYNAGGRIRNFSNKVIFPAEYSTFSKTPYRTGDALIPCIRGQRTKYDTPSTVLDCHFRRSRREMEPGRWYSVDYLDNPWRLEKIEEELTKYAQKIEAIILSNQQPSTPSQTSDSAEEKLLKLKSLLEKELITQEEYESKRAEVLKEL